ncbi:outer membrane protein [Paenochrobactrum pullorum]|uniref:outer membrane protein n=1 Tax=Paenochrobactrum pullorum TaxID=1324351 RepID=UPI0035BC00AA
MKYFAIAFTLLASTSAQAADLNAQPYNWSGAYIGIQAGGRWAEEKTEGMGPRGPVTTSIKPSGGLIGGYAGYNHKIGSFVVGAEIGAAFNAVSADWNMSFTDYRDKAKALISVNARLGYAFDRTLVYATGGWAHAKYSRSFRSDDSGIGFLNYDESFKRNGYNLGAGAEYALTDNVIARAEYRYHDFGRKTYYGDAGQAKYKQQTAVLGMTYKF